MDVNSQVTKVAIQQQDQVIHSQHLAFQTPRTNQIATQQPRANMGYQHWNNNNKNGGSNSWNTNTNNTNVSGKNSRHKKKGHGNSKNGCSKDSGGNRSNNNSNQLKAPRFHRDAFPPTCKAVPSSIIVDCMDIFVITTTVPASTWSRDTSPTPPHTSAPTSTL